MLNPLLLSKSFDSVTSQSLLLLIATMLSDKSMCGPKNLEFTRGRVPGVQESMKNWLSPGMILQL